MLRCKFVRTNSTLAGAIEMRNKIISLKTLVDSNFTHIWWALLLIRNSNSKIDACISAIDYFWSPSMPPTAPDWISWRPYFVRISGRWIFEVGEKVKSVSRIPHCEGFAFITSNLRFTECPEQLDEWFSRRFSTLLHSNISSSDSSFNVVH